MSGIVTNGRKMLTWLSTNAEAENTTRSFGSHTSGVGFAVHALHVPQLERLAAEIDRHPVAVFDMRRDEA